MNQLRTAIRARKWKIYALADQMNVTRGTLYRRFRQPEQLTLRELRLIRKLLNLEDREVVEIFFEEKSHDKQKEEEEKTHGAADL